MCVSLYVVRVCENKSLENKSLLTKSRKKVFAEKLHTETRKENKTVLELMLTNYRNNNFRRHLKNRVSKISLKHRHIHFQYCSVFF